LFHHSSPLCSSKYSFRNSYTTTRTDIT
jgi:hypothetical protein